LASLLVYATAARSHVHSLRYARCARARHWSVGCAPERPSAPPN